MLAAELCWGIFFNDDDDDGVESGENILVLVRKTTG
jgi:hypothetical protein